MQAQESLRVNQEFQARTINRLTSGYRINSSGDDAAGLSVANEFRSSVMELTQGVRNANDGISQLQVIDGGLTNISKMLDRMKTLATQSASTTFSGDRATLNKEYQTLLAEIDRQATNVNLNAGGTYNSKIEVYIGGAADAGSNAKVAIDLSTSSVDSAGLDIDTTSVLGGGVGFGAYTAERLDSSTAQFNSTVFTVDYVDSNNVAQQVTVTTAGSQSGAEEIDDINTQLADAKTGITAQINSEGKIEFVGNGAFAISTDGAAGGVTANGGTDMYLVNEGKFELSKNIAWTDFTEGTGNSPTETLKIIDSKGNSATIVINTDTIDLNANATGTLAEARDYINSQLRNAGVEVSLLVTQDGGNELSFQSSGDFTVQQSSFGVAAGTGAGVMFGNVPGLLGVGAQDENKTAGGQALQAIDKITAAVKKLGVVQGTVGTGQNQLSYAIQLANSQISNFSAAESRIRDADVAAEAANLTKAQVLQQASMAAMAQANSAPEAVLALLRG